MRDLIAWNVMTLDGYFEGEAPWDLAFHGTVWGEELEAFSLEQLGEIGTLLYGRKTYEGMFDYWSKETGAVADGLLALEKAVASRTLEAAEWANTRVLKGDAVTRVKALKEEPGKPVFVFGSADLLDALLRAGLVDEYRVCVAPMLLGSGTPLFKPGVGPMNWTLRQSRPLKTGGTLLFYRRSESEAA